MDKFILRADLMADEGFRAHVYDDTLGYATIGYGRCVDARKSGGITRDEACQLLLNDIDRLCDQLDIEIPWWKEQPENVQRALANLAYQCGVDGLLGFKNALAATKAGNYEEAYRHFLDSLWARQTPERALRVASLIRQSL